MAEQKLNDIIIHCHFDGEPSQELIEALNRMADLAAKNLGKEINNGDTEKRVANCDHKYSEVTWGSLKYKKCDKCGDIKEKQFT